MILSRLFSPFFLAGLLLSTSSAWAQEQTVISFSSGPVSLPINDLQTTTSTLEVSGLPSSLAFNTVIRVKASIDHTWVGDLALTIFSPSGTPVILANRLIGDCDFLYQDITFDDLALTPVTSATCPQPNTTVYYQPMVSLQSLIPEDLNGIWTFQVRDDAGADVGTINSWSIGFEEINDVDECALGTHTCDQNAICTNTIGSFTCQCLPSFEGNGFVCDLNECANGSHNCDQNAICTNTFGSFSCECLAGFAGDGVNCIEVDECALGTHTCDQNAICTNTIGSFVCQCPPGFEGNGLICDADECVLGTHNCSQEAICTNTLGSFTCTCMAGLEGDGVTCVDLLDAGDKAILDEFYDSISFPGKEDRQRPLHWCGSSFGSVTCENHRVSSIFFDSRQISGTIPSSFGSLSGLTYLNLGLNMFTGTIPTELGNLSGLWAMVLYYNQLTGPIPTELGNLPNFYGFDFSYNQLSGSIPTELGNARNLSVIFLQNNQLTGSLPSELRNLPNLNLLYLAGNPFCPAVDYSWVPNNDFFQGPHPSCTTSCVAETHYDFDLVEGEVGSSQTVPSKHVEGTYTFECTQQGEWAEVSNTLEAACPAGDTRFGFFDMTGHGKFATKGCSLDAPGYVIRYCSQAGVWEAAITSCPI